MIFLYAIVVGVLLIVTLLFIFYFRHLVPLRPYENGFRYVFIEEDGSVRELTISEQNYLTEKFDPTDGARPYIKTRIYSKTTSGSLSGFILRKRVPKDIPIKHIECQTQ